MRIRGFRRVVVPHVGCAIEPLGGLRLRGYGERVTAARVHWQETSAPKTAAPRIRVVIADDERLVRTGFRVILEDEPDIEVVGEAPDGRSAVDVVLRRRPDIVLMDIRMPRWTDSRRPSGCWPSRARDRRAHAHHVRPRPVHLRGAADRGQRLPAQGHAGGPAAGGGTGRRGGGGAAHAVDHAKADRRVRARGAAGSRRRASRVERAQRAGARCPAVGGAGLVERADRRGARAGGEHDQDARCARGCRSSACATASRRSSSPTRRASSSAS